MREYNGGGIYFDSVRSRSLVSCNAKCDRLGKGKAEHLYSALHGIQTTLTRSGMDHSFTCNKHHACLYFVRVHQMAPPPIEVANI